MKQKALWLVIVLWTAVFRTASMGYACSVCITGASDPMTDAFNWSVLFLMVTPYTVVGSIAGWLFYTYRRSAAKKQKEQATVQPLVLALKPEESGR